MGMKTRQVLYVYVCDEINFYLLPLPLWYVVFLRPSLYGHISKRLSSASNWFWTVNFVLSLEIQIHIYLKRDRSSLASSSILLFFFFFISTEIKSSLVIETHKSNWIPLYDYIALLYVTFSGTFCNSPNSTKGTIEIVVRTNCSKLTIKTKEIFTILFEQSGVEGGANI